MALYLATVDTPRRRGDVFAYLSDFSNTREWDPGVLEAELKLKGSLRRADPALGLVFNRAGDQALAGLRRTLREAHPRCLCTITGRALDGRARTLPDDLSKPYTFLIVAFRREQQQLVDGWLPWLTELERERPDVAVYELPVLSSRYGTVRWLIDGGMTRGIPDPAARARTITVYTDVEAVVANLGLVGTDTIAVVAVEPTGRILACETGGFDPRKAKQLAEILHRPALEEPEQPSRVNARTLT